MHTRCTHMHTHSAYACAGQTMIVWIWYSKYVRVNHPAFDPDRCPFLQTTAISIAAVAVAAAAAAAVTVVMKPVSICSSRRLCHFTLLFSRRCCCRKNVQHALPASRRRPLQCSENRLYHPLHCLRREMQDYKADHYCSHNVAAEYIGEVVYCAPIAMVTAILRLQHIVTLSLPVQIFSR